MIQLYSRQQRFAQLDAQFSALADRDRLDFDYLRFWFMTRGAPWDAKDDVDALRRYVDADAEDRWSRLALAEGLRRLGRVEEAEQLLQPMPDVDPEALAAPSPSSCSIGATWSMWNGFWPEGQPPIPDWLSFEANWPSSGRWSIGTRSFSGGVHGRTRRLHHPHRPRDRAEANRSNQSRGAVPGPNPSTTTAMPALIDRLIAAKAATDADLQRTGSARSARRSVVGPRPAPGIALPSRATRSMPKLNRRSFASARRCLHARTQPVTDEGIDLTPEARSR